MLITPTRTKKIGQMLLKNEAAASASSEMFATGAITMDWNKTMVITISDRILCLVVLISFSVCSFKKHQSPSTHGQLLARESRLFLGKLLESPN